VEVIPEILKTAFLPGRISRAGFDRKPRRIAACLYAQKLIRAEAH